MRDYMYLQGDLKRIFDEEDAAQIIKEYKQEVEKIESYIKLLQEESKQRILTVNRYMDNSDYQVLGRVLKHGKEKFILLTLRFPDGTQRDYRFYFNTIKEVRIKLSKLKNTLKGDWSQFED